MPRLRLLPVVESAETPEEATPILEYLMRRGGFIAIDTETTGLKIMRDRVLYWSMATEDRRFFFTAKCLPKFDALFRRKDITWCLANAKYDKHILANMGYDLAGKAWDIIDMDAMDDDTRDHGLKDQANDAYGAKWGEFKELFLDPHMVGETLGLDTKTFNDFKTKSLGDKLIYVYHQRPDIVENYATCDSYFTYVRAMDLAKTLANQPLETDLVPSLSNLFDYYQEIEVPFTQTLWGMERTGIKVDMDWVKKIDGPMRDGIASAESKLRKLTGHSFNPRSNDDIGEILYSPNFFGIKPLKFTAGGKGEPKPSTDEKTLSLIKLRYTHDSPEYRFIQAKLDLAKLDKLHGTYVKKLSDHVDPGTGRVHCRFNQSGTRTSRLSSSNPNMQNIPTRNDPYKIRGCFVADDGEDLIDYDYPQIEFRIAAALSNEKGMLEAIRKGWDIHSANAAAMYKTDSKVSYEAIMEAKRKKEERDPGFSDLDKYLLKKRDGAKTSGLGALYGEGPNKMAQDLKCSVDEARDLIETFFRANPRIREQIEYMHSFAEVYGFTHTMLGRVRRLHRISNDLNPGVAAAEKRQAYNTLIQGSGSEMMKLAMLQISNDPEFCDRGGRLALTVHDELVARAPKPSSARCAAIMKEKMSRPYNWRGIVIDYPVPVDPDGAIGYRWSDVK
jgi:DNA polymerase I-like protein with 3'-5' exonuclease and polymerase domains